MFAEKSILGSNPISAWHPFFGAKSILTKTLYSGQNPILAEILFLEQNHISAESPFWGQISIFEFVAKILFFGQKLVF